MFVLMLLYCGWSIILEARTQIIRRKSRLIRSQFINKSLVFMVESNSIRVKRHELDDNINQ